MGLRAAINSPCFEVDTFRIILTNLKKVNTQGLQTFHSQVLLDSTLKILEWLLKENEAIRKHYAENHTEYDSIIATGLMSKNSLIRKMYCQAVKNILIQTADTYIEVFEAFFWLVYGNFEKCDKSTLSLEYFDLYSELLEILRLHQ